MENNYIVAIDLGEANVVVAAGTLSSEGLIAVESIVSHPCDGIRCGMIENIALVEESLRGAVGEVERNLGIKIMEAYAGISGEFVRFACHSDHVYVLQPQDGVSQTDVDALFDRMSRVQAPDNETIMERIPQNYIVDCAKEVKNPVGSFGRRLSSTFNFILCGNTPMQRLDNALNKVGIKMLNIYPNAISVAESILTADEKEEGVVVVNIGAGLTDVTVYYRNVVRYIVSIPMGASAINADIRSMMIPDKYIEPLKCEYGSAVADKVSESKVIKVNGRTARESKSIVAYNLAVAIEARMSMLVDFVKREIAESGYEDKLPYGIVLTGGSAKLKNIDELFKRATSMEVRVGVPIEGITPESASKVNDPSYTTAVGILIRGGEQGICATLSNHYTTPKQDESASKKVVPKPLTPPIPPRTPPQPPKSTPSTTYTPPPPRPYTPPSAKSEDADSVEGKSSSYLSSQDERLSHPKESASNPEEEFEKLSAEVAENTKRGINFDIKNAFKGILDKLNKGFDGADEEEI